MHMNVWVQTCPWAFLVYFVQQLVMAKFKLSKKERRRKKEEERKERRKNKAIYIYTALII